MKKWFNLSQDKTDKSVATIRIYEQIGKNWFGEGTDAKEFTDAVDALGDGIETLNVHINSPGGNVYDGLAIYNYLKRHKAQVVGYVDGIAASIASVILMAADKIIMPSNSNVFIHNPFTYAAGDADALRKTADDLDAMKASLLGIYMTRANLDEADVDAMMNDETFMTAEEAVAWGFADEVEAESKMAADLNAGDLVSAALANARAEVQSRVQDAQLSTVTAERDNLQEQVNTLTETVNSLREQIGEPAPAMAASDVISACREAEAPEWLAANLIEAEVTDVTDAVARYSAIRDSAAAAGIEDAADSIIKEHWGDTPAMISALLVEGLASLDPEVTNRPPQADASDVAALDYTDVYAKRNPPRK